MLIPHGTVIALADGGGLKLYRNVGVETGPRLEPLPAPKLDSHSKDGGKRHRASTANPDQRLLQEDSLAAAIGDWLNQQAISGKIEGIVIAAPPKFLGELRRSYHKELKARLVAEFDKDLRELPAAEIEKELKLAK